MQSANTFVSTKDIDPGSQWVMEVSDQLNSAEIGVICLTQDNKDKPWILYEAGALAKGLTSNRVCTFLIDLEATDIEQPLAQFNHSLPTKESMFKLMSLVNSLSGDNQMKENFLRETFEVFWPKFEEPFKAIIYGSPALQHPRKRDMYEIVLEVLTTVRELQKTKNSDVELLLPGELKNFNRGKRLTERIHMIQSRMTFLTNELNITDKKLSNLDLDKIDIDKLTKYRIEIYDQILRNTQDLNALNSD